MITTIVTLGMEKLIKGTETSKVKSDYEEPMKKNVQMPMEKTKKVCRHRYHKFSVIK